jgi:hypothetical protein
MKPTIDDAIRIAGFPHPTDLIHMFIGDVRGKSMLGLKESKDFVDHFMTWNSMWNSMWNPM